MLTAFQNSFIHRPIRSYKPVAIKVGLKDPTTPQITRRHTSLYSIKNNNSHFWYKFKPKML